ncbi:MAG TPA: hypothetical protein VFB16_15245 [Bauldia sp.]|nr:hypothetical protein [Bauldia sp.]
MKQSAAWAGLFLLSLAVAPAQSGEAEQQVLRNYCDKELTPPAGVCDCLAARFVKLNDAQQSLLIALLKNDSRTAATARGQLKPDESLAAGTFMTRETPLCWPSG